jgi:hypothetical protein
LIALQLVKTLGIYPGIALLAAFFINSCGIFAYTRMTRGVDEWSEIRGQNVGVALLTGVMIIVLTLTMKHGVGMLVETWVPYPDTPRFY